ncbi:hypothetical protein [Sphingomicrobium aestuariivivum]|uniref:hypothetical protein n=1 Tax=Sphingomicrobium aestuariivivum TaxID=1582356 RepID=UPI001FD6DEA6|nr:hypothetical protein [Sphingomicrobium aestuariivivum]MCJ8190389.1 hypothetical protein [Sphingomicrobium aestuariivivum]
MKKLAFALTGAVALSLAACGQDQEDVVEEVNDGQVEQLEAQADTADDLGMEAESEALEDQADALEEQGEAAEEAAEDADGDVL